MDQTVGIDFEAIGPQVFFDFLVVGVALRDKIEGRPKSASHFQLSQFQNPILSFLMIHIVRQNKDELLAVGPTGPIGWG